MNDFYLTLPSNTSKTDTTANFSVHLPYKLHLQGKWEVALVEIQYPHSWNNVYGEYGKRTPDNWLDVAFSNGFVTTVFVPAGYYGSITELIDGIRYGQEKASESLDQTMKLNNDISEKINLQQENIDGVKFGFTFLYDATIKRVKCKFLEEQVTYIELSPKLQYMLGFDRPGLYNEKELAKYNHDTRVGFYSLFVYCSLVEPQIVGNVTAPLLRCVHIEGNYGDIIEKTYQSPHYVPVIAKEIDRIEIDIKDDNNQSVPFQFGKTVVKLHFRKKRYQLS